MCLLVGSLLPAIGLSGQLFHTHSKCPGCGCEEAVGGQALAPLNFADVS